MGNPQKQILIVDDSADDRNLFVHYLSQKGYAVSTARDGKGGLEKAVELQPDLVLLDLWLPLVSGWAILKRLKSDPGTQDIPILVVTGHSLVRPLQSAGLLTKPVRLEDS